MLYFSLFFYKGTFSAISDSFSNTNLGILHIAKSDPNIIFAGTSTTLRKTINGGKNWTISANPGSGMTSLLINPHNNDVLYITRSNYNANQKVYKSLDGGKTWTNISGSSLPNLPANHIQYYNNGKNGLFLAMDIGVYYLDDTTKDWELVSDGLPNVEIKDIEISEKDGRVIVATYGRGIWQAKIDPIVPYCTFNGEPFFISKDVVQNSVLFGWNKANGSFYNYEWAISSSPTVRTITQLETADTIRVTGLFPDEDYYFHVRARCNAGNYSPYKVYGPFRIEGCGPADFKTDGGLLTNISSGSSNIQWMSCENNQITPIAGANNETYNVTKTGSYAMAITINGCRDTSLCKQVILTKVDNDFAKYGIAYYPNPANDVVKITSQNTTIQRFTIKNIVGANIISGRTSQNNLEVSVAELKAGSYIINLQLGDGKEFSLPLIKL